MDQRPNEASVRWAARVGRSVPEAFPGLPLDARSSGRHERIPQQQREVNGAYAVEAYPKEKPAHSRSALTGELGVQHVCTRTGR